MADLIRLWNYARLFDIDERGMSPGWEAALAEASEPALRAENDTELQAIADKMMAHIDPVVPEVSPQASKFKDTPGFSVVNGYAIASCASIAYQVGGNAPRISGDAKAFAAAVKKQGAIIFDCRRLPGGEEGYGLSYVFGQWFPGAVAEYLRKPIPRGSTRLRMHDGYPPDRGGTSGQYVRGTFDQDLGELRAEGAAAGPRIKLLFLADASTPDLRGLVGSLQASGQARVLAQGPLINDDRAPFQAKHVHAMVRRDIYVSPAGHIGWAPDACVAARTSDGLLMKTARSMLNGAKGPACKPQAIAAPVPVASASSGDNSAAPPLGERMIALAKLWGTFEYFHPYKDLNSRPWESELEAFVPVFAAAESRAAYEDAVQSLAARAEDSHVRVTGLKASRFAGSSAVPIYVVPVEEGFAVGGVEDPSLTSRIRIGDEIVAVDGKPVREIATGLAPMIATSTPQWLAQVEAGFLLRGPKGSSARLTLRRGNAAPFDVMVARSVPYVPRPKPPEPSFHLLGSDVGYVDMERLAPADADRAIDALLNTRAIIFDLRGYPQGTGWTIAPRLALSGREEAVDAQFRRPIYIGPGDPQQEWKSFSQRIPRSEKPRYRGKVIVLIDARAISQSEHTAMMFEAAANPIFVGTPTAGANGDVTNVGLPGGLFVSFTGHDVRHADGRQLQRVGIQPNVVVAPTFTGMQSGHDEVLEAGLAVARRP